MAKIDIISGFLGAGKTTLIKKLIAEAFPGEKLVLIENEFGEIGIDGGFLKEAGIQITEMNSGCICCSLVGDFGKALKEVLEKYIIDSLVPDIVIMDINIPIMNGLKVIQTSRLKYPDMAFIVVSGYDDFSYCREALRLQITDYILKPVDYEEFGNTIDHLKISIFEKQTKDVTPGSEASTIVGIVRYMQEHLAEEISLNVLAETFHLSAQYISQLFKNEIGVNFLAYLTTIRMECAKKLLVSTQLSIAEISERCGYADYRVFTKVFKKTEGSTPSQYRRDFL